MVKLSQRQQNPKVTLTLGSTDGSMLYGLANKIMMRWIEDLPGSSNCINYRFHMLLAKPSDALLRINTISSAEGCARAVGYNRKLLTRAKRSRAQATAALDEGSTPEDKFKVSAVSSDAISERRDDADSLPVAMRYRKLSEPNGKRTRVGKSPIQGRGLMATAPIRKHEFVIEYVGELVRSAISEHRELLYNSKGIGCYMFGIMGSPYVIDATMAGNSARFINHSCEPNCESRLITIDGKKKIVISALRDIEKGEELCYDYKFVCQRLSFR